MHSELVYPISPSRRTFLERVALKAKALPCFCLVCGRLTIMALWGDNFRETGFCVFCKSMNRHRQIAYAICGVLQERGYKNMTSLSKLSRSADLSIYNTESSGAVHNHLMTIPGYLSSEYFGPNHSPGEIVDNIRHEDIAELSFEDNKFDFVLSSDVLEHVPEPYKAHAEIYRVLKPGGAHIFTVPFHQTDYIDDVLAVPGADGPVLLKPPIYHHDPIRPEGILVYTIFSIEMLSKLNELGFLTSMYRIYRPKFGILGANALVFVAYKGKNSLFQ
jgi:hypothetical protein